MTDAIEMPVSVVTEEGLKFTESKTAKSAVIEWTPTLRSLVPEITKAREALDPQSEHGRLLTNRFGKPLTQPSHAHPGPMWQMSFLEMQVLPQAFPTVQILRHAKVLIAPVDEVLNPKVRLQSGILSVIARITHSSGV